MHPTDAANAHALAELTAEAWALRTRDPARGALAGQQAVDLARALGDQPALATALSALSSCLRNASKLVAAAQAGKEAVAVYAALPQRQPAAESKALVNHGIALTMLGRTSEALGDFEAARALSHAAGDTHGEADALLDIAVVANMLGDNARAVALYQQVLPLYEALGDDYHRASALNNMAYALVCWGTRCASDGDPVAATGHFAQAVLLADQALPLAERSEHPDFVVSCLDTRAAALREQGHWEQALASLDHQLRLARGLTGRRMEAVSLATLGEVQRRAGQLGEATTTLQQADRLFGELQLAEQHAGALQSLVEALAASGQTVEALAVHRRFHALELRVRADAAAQKLQTLEARLQLERAESELQLSRQRADELAALNARLVAVDQEREALLVELRRLSGEDALTGLANRRAFEARLLLEAQRSRRQGTALSVALIDIDHFKLINDQGSHALGDQVLRRIARLLSDHSRPTDLAARLGGDELVLLLPDTDVAGALALARLIGQRMAEADWQDLTPAWQPTLSIGIDSLVADPAASLTGASPGPADQELGQRLLAAADSLLYRAKAGGRNRVCTHTACWPLSPARAAGPGDAAGPAVPDPVAAEPPAG